MRLPVILTVVLLAFGCAESCTAVHGGALRQTALHGGAAVQGPSMTPPADGDDAPWPDVWAASFVPPSWTPTCSTANACLYQCTADAGSGTPLVCRDANGTTIPLTYGTAVTVSTTPHANLGAIEFTDANGPSITTPASWSSWIAAPHTVVFQGFSANPAGGVPTAFSQTAAGVGFLARNESGMRCIWANSGGAPTSITVTTANGGTLANYGLASCRKTGSGAASSYYARSNGASATSAWAFDPADPTTTSARFGRGASAGNAARGVYNTITVYTEAKSDAWIADAEARTLGLVHDGITLSNSRTNNTASTYFRDGDGYLIPSRFGSTRIDADGLHIEATRANPWAADANNVGSWTDVGTPTITAGTASGPFSRANSAAEADTITDDDAGAKEGKRSATFGTTNSAWTASCLMQPGTIASATVSITTTGGSGGGECAFADIADECAPDPLSGWYRCECTRTISGSPSAIYGNVLVGDDVTDVGTIIVSQCQGDSGSAPTPPRVSSTSVASSRVAVPDGSADAWYIADGGEVEIVWTPYRTAGDRISYLLGGGDDTNTTDSLVLYLDAAGKINLGTYSPSTSTSAEELSFSASAVTVTRGTQYVVRARWSPDVDGLLCHEIWLDECADASTCTATTVVALDVTQGDCGKYPPTPFGRFELGAKIDGTSTLDGQIARVTVRDHPTLYQYDQHTVQHVARVLNETTVEGENYVLSALVIDGWIKHAKSEGYWSSLSGLYLLGGGIQIDGSGEVADIYNAGLSSGDAHQSGNADRCTHVDAEPAHNNLPAIDCDGVSSFYGGVALSNFVSASAMTAFVVFSLDSVDTNDGNIFENDLIFGGETTNQIGLHAKSTGDICFANYDGTADTACTTWVAATQYIAEMRHEGGSIYLRLNDGAEVSAASGNTSSLTGLRRYMGQGASGAGGYVDGTMAMAMSFNTALTSDQRAAIRTRANEIYQAW